MISGISNCITSGFSKCFKCCPLAGRCHNLNWRDYIMATGLVFTITGLAIAILESSTLFIGLFAISTFSLFVGTYFVNRVKELEGMEKNLTNFQNKIEHLERINGTLKASVSALQKEIEEHKRLNGLYAEENRRHKEHNEHLQKIADEFETMKTQIKELPGSFAPLTKELFDTIEKLNEYKAKSQEAEKEHEERLSRLDGKLEERQKALEELQNNMLRIQQEGETRLRELFTCLQAVSTNLAANADRITNFFPNYVELAARVTHFLSQQTLSFPHLRAGVPA